MEQNKLTEAQEKEVEERMLAEINADRMLMDQVAKRHNVAKVIMLKVPKDDLYTDFAIAYLKYPSRIDVSICMTLKNTDPLKGKQIVIENSWLEGDKEILTDDQLFMSACTGLDDLLSIRQSIVKKNFLIGQ